MQMRERGAACGHRRTQFRRPARAPGDGGAKFGRRARGVHRGGKGWGWDAQSATSTCGGRPLPSSIVPADPWRPPGWRRHGARGEPGVCRLSVERKGEQAEEGGRGGGGKDPPTDARPPRRNRAADIVAAERATAAAANGRDCGAGRNGHATGSSRFHRGGRGGSGDTGVAPVASPLMHRTGGGQRHSGWRWRQASGGWHPSTGGGGSGEKRKVGKVGECAAPPRPSPRPSFLPLYRGHAQLGAAVAWTSTVAPSLAHLPAPHLTPLSSLAARRALPIPIAAAVLGTDAPAAK